MARKVVRVSSNPNPTSYDDNPYKQIGKTWRWNPETGQGEIDDTKAPKRTVKVNSNPVPKTTIKTSSPTTDAVRQWSEDNRARERHYGLEKGSTKSIYKVDSNPVKPGKTRIGNLAGGGLGGMFGVKNR